MKRRIDKSPEIENNKLQKLNKEIKDYDFSGLSVIQKIVLKAYVDCGFNLTEAARQCDLPYVTVSSWRHKDENFKAAYYVIRERMLDIAESALMDSIKKGSEQSAQFILKQLAKARGYGEKVEVNHSGSIGIIPINIITPTINIDNINED